MKSDEVETQNDRSKDNTSTPKKHESAQDGFQIWETPKMTAPPIFEDMQDVDPELIAKTFEFSALSAKSGEDATKNKISDLVKASASGTSTTILFSQGTIGKGKTDGMSLAHVWFGTNFPLFRHSHAAYGDCMYYVIHGKIQMGERRLTGSSGPFVPNGHPYRFTAGPAGVELLEFRAGGGQEGALGLKMEEKSLDRIQEIIEEHHVQRPKWRQPEQMGDSAYIQQEINYS